MIEIADQLFTPWGETMLNQTVVTAKPYKTPVRIWITLGVIFLIFGTLIIWHSNTYREQLLNNVYEEASFELSATASSLSSILESRLLLANGLNAYITAEIMDKHEINQTSFEAFGSLFIHKTEGIRNLSVYPAGIAKFVYPLMNNEALLGLNLLTHSNPDIRLNAERTMLTPDITILGPLELTQGGIGILTRQSIFEDYEFWGFVSVVLDVPPILQEAGFYDSYKGIELAVRANNQIIMGDPQLFESSRLRDLVPLPEGTWEISAAPKQAKLDSVQTKVLGILITSLLSLILILYFLYVQLTQRAKLHALVNDRTLNLELANKQLEVTYNELTSAEKELRGQYDLLENKEQAVRQMAYHDSITGLYNRAYFNDYLEKIIADNEPATHRIALLFLDLDHFKMTNDTIGHFYGDILLNEVGRRLQQLLTDGEIISRFGGDEFTIILPAITDVEQVQVIAQHVNGLFHHPFILNDAEHFVTTSIGIALFPEHGENATALIMNADMAMYRAKDDGKNQYRFYDSSLNPDAEATMEIKNSLSRALERDEFLIYYQPQVNAQTGRIVGLEALLRWNHSKLGMIPPSSFIPIAEDTGLIVPIGDWILRNVCAQSKAWQRVGLPPIRIAVNLSARQFLQRNLTERIKEILDESELDAKYLELEITENIAMNDDKLPTLQELSHMGITISIDDFGTQYSSLGYLKRLPVNKIKIDRSFVNGISKDPKDEAIILAMLLIADRLNLTATAEGVETVEQLLFLQDNNCQDIQGFLFYMPQPSELMKDILMKQAAFT